MPEYVSGFVVSVTPIDRALRNLGFSLYDFGPKETGSSDTILIYRKDSNRGNSRNDEIRVKRADDKTHYAVFMPNETTKKMKKALQLTLMEDE
ncbi:MAG: hypothetical protein NT120_00420 [Candidatus Aenigmarchaeota archaeon]|nr:hypothetical protein [Candidatus Aenigmarchaeota archaeon]